MSATQTSTRTDSRKLMPITRAWATASHASHSTRTPPARRTGLRDASASPATPPRSSHAPASTHSRTGDRPRARAAAARAGPRTRRPRTARGRRSPPNTEPPWPSPFRRPHSQAPRRSAQASRRERNRRRPEQRRQQDGQQDDGRDDALLEHELSAARVRRRAGRPAAPPAPGCGRSAARAPRSRPVLRRARRCRTRARACR